MAIIPNIDLFDVTLSFWKDDGYSTFWVFPHPSLGECNGCYQNTSVIKPYIPFQGKYLISTNRYTTDYYEFPVTDSEFYGTKQEFLEHYRNKKPLILPPVII